jgi:chromosome segregation ATPase
MNEKTAIFLTVIIFSLAVSTCTTGCKSNPVIIDSGITQLVEDSSERADAAVERVREADAEQRAILEDFFREIGERNRDAISRSQTLEDTIERAIREFEILDSDYQWLKKRVKQLEDELEAQGQVAADSGDI